MGQDSVHELNFNIFGDAFMYLGQQATHTNAFSTYYALDTFGRGVVSYEVLKAAVKSTLDDLKVSLSAMYEADKLDFYYMEQEKLVMIDYEARALAWDAMVAELKAEAAAGAEPAAPAEGQIDQRVVYAAYLGLVKDGVTDAAKADALLSDAFYSSLTMLKDSLVKAGYPDDKLATILSEQKALGYAYYQEMFAVWSAAQKSAK